MGCGTSIKCVSILKHYILPERKLHSEEGTLGLGFGGSILGFRFTGLCGGRKRLSSVISRRACVGTPL